MGDAIKREEVSEIARKLSECLNHLQRGNIFSCLVRFREALEKTLSTKMLASDEKELIKNINTFQQDLAGSRIFREVYGPVTFHDNDIATTLDFMKQLIRIKEEETIALMEEKEGDDMDHLGHPAPASKARQLIRQIKVLLEKGDYATAQEMIAGDEDIACLIVEEYNGAGMRYRREGMYDEAINEFKKALLVQPRDEGLYYNIARVRIAREEWKEAAEVIVEGLKINPHFTEGIKILKYIREHTKLDGWEGSGTDRAN